MPKKIPPLSELKIKNAKATDGKLKRLYDGDGLVLEVTPKGGKLWRFKYQFEGKEKKIAFGIYPDVSLDLARERRHEARKLVAQGIDPAAVRKDEKTGKATRKKNTFELLAREWLQHTEGDRSSQTHKKFSRFLELDVYPKLGERPVAEIEAPELLEVVRLVEARKAFDVAHQVHRLCGQVFRYAIQTGRASRDPSVDLKGALKKRLEVKHRAAILEPAKVGALLRAIEGFEGHYVTKCALRLLPLLAVRPGELRHMEWAEIDLDGALWSIPGPKMKMKQAHLVPLSKQALEILREIQALTGRGRLVFPGIRTGDRPLSDVTLNAALRRMGYTKDDMTSHGWRSVFRTLADEKLKQRPDWIEHQLAHAVHGPLGRAYNRAQFLEERGEMMQLWSDYLDTLKTVCKVIPLFPQAVGE